MVTLNSKVTEGKGKQRLVLVYTLTHTHTYTHTHWQTKTCFGIKMSRECYLNESSVNLGLVVVHMRFVGVYLKLT